MARYHRNMQSSVSVRLTDSSYPELLRQIHHPPDPLFVRGSLPASDRLWVAVVGSRKASSYGLAAVSRLVKPLAERGIVIVSGLAFGIDAAAHEAALAVSGTTVAVLGSPAEEITPRSHMKLANQILESGGAIISEVPTGGYVGKTNFAIRNRIISGLCHATLVVEAAMGSGSLITATLALDENREVFAVPGPITSPTSVGTNNLLKVGARPATEANDLLVALGVPTLPFFEKAMPRLAPHEEQVLSVLSDSEPCHIDTICTSARINLQELQAQLTLLEIRGLVTMVQPGWYIRIR